MYSESFIIVNNVRFVGGMFKLILNVILQLVQSDGGSLLEYRAAQRGGDTEDETTESHLKRSHQSGIESQQAPSLQTVDDDGNQDHSRHGHPYPAQSHLTDPLPGRGSIFLQEILIPNKRRVKNKKFP